MSNADTKEAIPSDTKRQLPLVTNSELRAFRTCARLHFHRYLQGYRPVATAYPLWFGTLTHFGLNAWWSWWLSDPSCGRASFATPLAAAIDALLAKIEKENTWRLRYAEKHRIEPATLIVDHLDAVRAEAMLIGYDARWRSEHESGALVTVAVEQKFEAPLINPLTNAASRTYRLGGKLDCLAKQRDGHWIVEHKTSADDISPGSDYWKRVSSLDPQISAYYLGARALGFDPVGCLYDVLAKPKLRPLIATQESARKFTKEGKLYATQRDKDETPDEFKVRLLAEIASKPERYYQRGSIVRLEDELTDASYDLWSIARLRREAEIDGRHPRNVDSCTKWGRDCEFLTICARLGSLDDETRFRKASTEHEELTDNEPAL